MVWGFFIYKKIAAVPGAGPLRQTLLHCSTITLQFLHTAMQQLFLEQGQLPKQVYAFNGSTEVFIINCLEDSSNLICSLFYLANVDHYLHFFMSIT